MATKKKEELESRTVFVIPREDFTQRLQKRIQMGKELATNDIKTIEQLESITSEFYKWENINKEIIKQAFNKPDSEYYYQYSRLNASSGLMDYMQGVDTQSDSYKAIKLKRNILHSIAHLEELIEKSDLISEDVSIARTTTPTTKTDVVYNAGFLIHGHNETRTFEVARFVEKELEKKMVILHEQANRGNTIIEKFEKNSDVDFAIALWTADDQGKSNEETDLKSRARQNVVFETGFFIGKLGRSKVIVLYEDGVELPSDYNGVVFIILHGNWMHSLKREIDAIYQDQ